MDNGAGRDIGDARLARREVEGRRDRHRARSVAVELDRDTALRRDAAQANRKARQATRANTALNRRAAQIGAQDQDPFGADAVLVGRRDRDRGVLMHRLRLDLDDCLGWPAGIVTLEGVVITGLDDLSVTTAPPAGASAQSVTRTEMTLPPVALPEPYNQRSVLVPADCPASAGVTVPPIVTNATTTRNNVLRNLSVNIAIAIPRAG